MWNIVYSSEFEQWFFSLNEDEQDSVLYSLNVLKQIGPQLGRPHVDTIQGTELCNLKELRIQHQGYPYRALFFLIQNAKLLCCALEIKLEMRICSIRPWLQLQFKFINVIYRK